jgi:pyruvate dehydrogenase E1 component alpha subunit
MDRDPIKNLTTWLLEQKLADSAQLSAIESELTVEMDKAVEFAVGAPYPSPEEVEQDVYA